MLYGLKEGTVGIPGGDLNYIAFGKGSRNLIIIQGLNVRDIRGAGITLAPMYRIFAKDFRVWLFDRRMSVQPGLTHRDLAGDIFHAMNALGIDSADVFGVSQGGMIALALTLDHPEKVSKLVLGVTAARTNDTLRKRAERWAECARRRDYISINRDTFSLMYTEAYLRRYRFFLPLAVRLVKPKDFDRFAVLASALLSFDYTDRLKEIRCPVLVLGSEQDQIVTGQASCEIAEALHCEIHMYKEYGHAAYEEAKDFNNRVYRFLMK